MRLLFLILFLCTTLVFAQSYSTGVPVPGLPNSVGPKTMAGSTSVTIATDQTALPITVTVSGIANIGLNGDPAPTSSGLIGFIDPNGDLQPFRGDSSNGITVTAKQGTTPWVISGGVAITNTPNVVASRDWLLSGATDSVGVTGTVGRTWLLSGATDSVGITGTVTASRNWLLSGATDSVGVTGTVGRTWNLNSSTDSVAITGTVSATPITVSASSITQVANNVANQTLLVNNSNRKQVFLFNDSTTNCYVKFGATASTSSFTIKMFSTDTYIMDPPTYTGIIDYLCDASTGNMEVTEQ